MGEQQNAVKLCLSGLKKLEYRGYDSAGIAGWAKGRIRACRALGKVAHLESKIDAAGLELETAIAHTRWATHGIPSEQNAHPHLDNAETLAVVHNGIIENHEELRQILQEEGVVFRSQTDTEVVSQLIAHVYQGDLLEAVQQTLSQLRGAYALAVVHEDHPHQIIAAAQQSPLAIGLGNGEAFVASDTHAFLVHTREVVYLHDGEVALVTPDRLDVYDRKMEEVIKQSETLANQAEDASKGDYEHFTLKEIHEQPQTIRNALLARYLHDYGTVCMEEMGLNANDLKDVQNVLILACGTSWHAGYVASYLLEDRARIPTRVEISSEFRYKNPVLQDNTLVLAISQSGETADTIAAVRELKAKGAKMVAICNVQGSTLAREADGCILLRAGQEIGVCSTKAFTSQLVVLSLFALAMARMRHMSQEDGCEVLAGLERLPEQVQVVLNQVPYIRVLAKKYARYENFFYLGRRYMYPCALEGALKLKEISYINANGYPAGEMKHGPIALIGPSCPTVAFCADTRTYEKTLSNLMEVKARQGPLIAIAEEGAQGLQGIADDIIFVPRTIDELSAIPSSVAAQLFAYYVALERGAEIDQPRNLAKSVTVE